MIINEINNKELGIIECLAIGRNIFRKKQMEILAVAFLIGIPVNILLAFAYKMVAGINLNINLEEITQSTEALNSFIQSGQYTTLGLYLFVVVIIQGMFFPLVTMAAARISKDFIYGKTPNVSQAIMEAFQKGWILIIAAAIHETLVFSGTLFFIVPGLYFQIIFFFYVYAIMLDDKGIIESMLYSNSLVKGYFLKTAVMSILIYSLNYSVSYIIGWAFSFGEETLVSSIISGTITTFIGCMFVCTITVFYINRQCLKKDGRGFQV